jgi:hypothetical protein
MNRYKEIDKRLRQVSRGILLAAVLLTIAAYATPAETSSAAPQLMFVQSAEGLNVDTDSKTFRLVKVNQQALYFSDRPQRIAGHLTMADFLKEWTAKAGQNNFGDDPPNAVLSVYEPGKPDNTTVVVEITNPVVDGTDLVYNYKIIKGKMPAGSGATSLFIDWIGLGGGVGRGFHGVGVGRRGPGVRGW